MKDNEKNYQPLLEMQNGLKPIASWADLQEGINDEIVESQDGTFLKICKAIYNSRFMYGWWKDVESEFWEHLTSVKFFDCKEAKWLIGTYFITKYKEFLNFSESEFNLLYDQFMDCYSFFIKELLLWRMQFWRERTRQRKKSSNPGWMLFVTKFRKSNYLLVINSGSTVPSKLLTLGCITLTRPESRFTYYSVNLLLCSSLWKTEVLRCRSPAV